MHHVTPLKARAMRASLPGLEQLERPKSASVRGVQSTGYGNKWLPPQGDKFAREYFIPGQEEEEEARVESDGEEVTNLTLVNDEDGVVDEY
jgi:hypothetical protein